MKLPKPDQRAELLTQRRNKKMARSPHAYVRGSTRRFYDWLHTQSGRHLPQGPQVWICGDCHSSNLGPLGNRHGRINMQIRDLDQTVIGNPAHDLVRLALSLASAARGSALPGVTTVRMLEAMVRGYEQAMVDRPDELPERPSQVKSGMRSAVKRTWKNLARERIQGKRLTLPMGKTFWPLAEEEAEAIRGLGATPELHHLITSLKGRPDETEVELLDAAYWVKGCSSLGLLRYALLLRIGDPDDAEFCLIDAKEAVAALAPRGQNVSMPRDNAQRVVEGARHLSPALGERMLATRLLDSGFSVRELLPQDMKLDMDNLTRDDAVNAAGYLARVIGVAHGRQMDADTRKAWLAELQRNRSKTLDAPSWLWTNVVQLLSSHEQGYLEHCRRYAQQQKH